MNSETSYHKHLQRQINRYLPERLASDPDLQRFLSKINDSFEANDKDRELSERAFRISEEEYD